MRITFDRTKRDKTLAERGLEILAEPLGLEPLGQRMRAAVLEQPHLESPVVAHEEQSI